MRIFCQGDLVRPSAIRFATNYITINSILNKRDGLRQLFTSDEWYNSRFSEFEEGKRIESKVLDHRFWDAMEGVQSIYEPLVISKDVRSGDTSSFERDMLGPRQGQRRPLRDNASANRKESSSNSSDNDGGNNAGSGGNE
ncbi:hypothetical protein L3X38_003970 [Prunus dulcis]|uniref:Uncharacterized protein n=1 Tax=Prunus dulcis TaxID=3755 RepID=A0AAD5F2R8_PRUDU|nr:hypothetical protein L3X38_003970 [Prunus dulcis]